MTGIEHLNMTIIKFVKDKVESKRQQNYLVQKTIILNKIIQESQL